MSNGLILTKIRVTNIKAKQTKIKDNFKYFNNVKPSIVILSITIFFVNYFNSVFTNNYKVD